MNVVNNVVRLPSFQHFEDCDALTIGRFVIASETASPPMARPAWYTSVLPQLERDCDCGKLRISAIETELERAKKARETVTDPKAKIDLSTRISELLARREAILAELNP